MMGPWENVRPDPDPRHRDFLAAVVFLSAARLPFFCVFPTKRPSRMTTTRPPTRTPLDGSGMIAPCSVTDSRDMNKNTGNDECVNGPLSRRWQSGDYFAGRNSSAKVGVLCAIDRP